MNSMNADVVCKIKFRFFQVIVSSGSFIMIFLSLDYSIIFVSGRRLGKA
jgi:hypothetical protein